jgi:hypothetical protein
MTRDNPAIDERLVILMEENAEVIQAIAKILRFGENSIVQCVRVDTFYDRGKL